MIVAQYWYSCGAELTVCFLSGKALLDVQCDHCWRRAVLTFIYGREC